MSSTTTSSSAHALQPRLLLGPGPSPVERRILDAMAAPTVGHLDPLFLDLLDDVSERLRSVFGTENRTTFPVSGTGSAGMEAAVANVVEPGDTAIVGVNGVFGGRIAEVVRRVGGRAVEVSADWGRIVPPERLMDALGDHPEAAVLAVVHAETSTGVRQPVGEIGSALRDRSTLFLVDAVTSLGGIPVDVDENGVDVCYAGTQKCLGVPPGLAPVTFSAKAMERIRRRETPCSSWYLDVSLISDYLGPERRYHHTAPINAVYGLHEGLRIVEEEGMDARYERHREVGRRLQEALVERGFRLFAEEGHRLPQLTAAELPDGRDEGPLRRRLLLEHGIEVGGGLGPGKGRLWRIGLMGAGATHEHVDRLLSAVDGLLGAAP